jgi:acyl-coenzyme A synthetase/AMP-(fatty) acid ligase
MAIADFSWDVPPSFNFGRDVIDALGHEDRRGLLFIDAAGTRTEVSFPAIAEATQRWAGALRDLGIGKDERVVVLLPKIPAWLYSMVAFARLGAVVVPCSEQLRAKDLAFRAQHSEATTIVAHVSNRNEVDLLREIAPGLTRFLLVGESNDAPGWIALDERVTSAEPFAGNPTRSDDLARVEHGGHRLGEVALERAPRAVVVRVRDRARRGRLRSREAHGSHSRSRGDGALSGADRIST